MMKVGAKMKNKQYRVYLPSCLKSSAILGWRFEKYINDISKIIGFEIVSEFDENVDIAHFYSCKSYLENEKVLAKYNIPYIFHAFATKVGYDYIVKDKRVESIALSKDTIKAMNGAACVVVFLPSQKTYLEQTIGITSKIEVIEPLGIDYREYDDLTKSAFTKVNRIFTKNRYIVDLEEFDWKDRLDDVESIARIMPDIDFFNFTFRKKPLGKVIGYSTELKNSHYIYRLSIPLIPSMVVNSSLLLVRERMLSSLYLADFISSGIPVLTTQNLFLNDMVMVEDDLLCFDDVNELYKAIQEKLKTRDINNVLYSFVDKDDVARKMHNVYTSFIKNSLASDLI